MSETPTITAPSGSDSVSETAATAADRRMLIDGQLVEAARTFATVNPATGEVLGYAPAASVADAEAAVAAARRAFDGSGRAKAVALRGGGLGQFHAPTLAER